MSEGLAPSARGGLSLSDGFPVSICQVRLCTARRSPLLSPGYLLPLSPAGSAAAPGPLPTTARRRGRLKRGMSTADRMETKEPRQRTTQQGIADEYNARAVYTDSCLYTDAEQMLMSYW